MTRPIACTWYNKSVRSQVHIYRGRRRGIHGNGGPSVQEVKSWTRGKTGGFTTYGNLRLQISSPQQSVDLGNFRVIPVEVHW